MELTFSLFSPHHSFGERVDSPVPVGDGEARDDDPLIGGGGVRRRYGGGGGCLYVSHICIDCPNAGTHQKGPLEGTSGMTIITRGRFALCGVVLICSHRSHSTDMGVLLCF